jgi:EAL domain-containing protein (putative c-di-GMP-specific phosphodiesterase class I)
VPGGAVLPLAEECDAVAEIGAWTLRRACADARSWPEGMVSVAVSPRHLAQGGLVDAVEAALRESKLTPARLSLELPEAALLAAEPEGQVALSMVRDLGAGVVVDDFGSAMGSLAMLRRLPLTGMKLDRSLVRGLPGESQDTAMVGAIVAAARALGMTTVAKGVETEAQRACLAALGCDEAQGYLFARTDQDG